MKDSISRKYTSAIAENHFEEQKVSQNVKNLRLTKFEETVLYETFRGHRAHDLADRLFIVLESMIDFENKPIPENLYKEFQSLHNEILNFSV